MSDAHENLLEEWSKRDLHARQCFIKDGIIDPVRWQSASPKVLILLKEAYDDPGETEGWDLRQLIREGDGPNDNTFWSAAYWCYAAHGLVRGPLPPQPTKNQDYVEARESFLSSAILNIKKKRRHPVFYGCGSTVLCQK